MEPPVETTEPASVTSYTVQNNDNLEKISQKVYGTSKKWKQIFEANQDQLKNPDRIYAGMVLKIPDKESPQPRVRMNLRACRTID